MRSSWQCRYPSIRCSSSICACRRSSGGLYAPSRSGGECVCCLGPHALGLNTIGLKLNRSTTGPEGMCLESGRGKCWVKDVSFGIAIFFRGSAKLATFFDLLASHCIREPQSGHRYRLQHGQQHHLTDVSIAHMHNSRIMSTHAASATLLPQHTSPQCVSHRPQ